jgi:vitamin B12 transporter
VNGAPNAPQQPAQAPSDPSQRDGEAAGRAAVDDVPEIDDTVVTARPFPVGELRDDASLTATRVQTPLSNVGSSVTIITRDQIRDSGQTSLAEILRTVPGLDIAQAGGPGRQSSAFLRGSNSNQTKVMMDGVWLNDPTANRAFDLSNLTLDNIERIEVLRGPQSTLYGSDAIGGVINIITRRGRGPARLQFSTQAGSYDTSNQVATLSGGTERSYYSLTGSYFDTNGFSAAESGTERDGYRNGTMSGRAGIVFNEQLDVDVVFRYADSDSKFDSYAFDPLTGASLPVDGLANTARSESFYSRTQIRSVSLDGMLEQKVGFNYTNTNRDSLTPGLNSHFNGDVRMVDWQANLTVLDRDQVQDILTVGAMYLQEDVLTSNTFVPLPSDRSLFNRGVYLQNTMVLYDQWTVTAGTRWDQFSRSGDANTYRVTSRYQIPEDGVALHGSIGTGFRAPSINELFGFAGNPNLRPEKSRGWDCGLEQRFADEKLIVDATYFRNDYDDLIVFVLTNPPFTGELFNVSTARTHGVELTATWLLDERTQLSAGYTRCDSRGRDPNSGVVTTLLRRPRDKFSVSVDRSLCDGRGNFNLTLRYVGRRTDVAPIFGDPPIELDHYMVANLGVWFDVQDDLRLFGRVDNVFDEEYQEINGFQTAGLSAYAGLMWTWGG